MIFLLPPGIKWSTESTAKKYLSWILTWNNIASHLKKKLIFCQIKTNKQTDKLITAEGLYLRKSNIIVYSYIARIAAIVVTWNRDSIYFSILFLLERIEYCSSNRLSKFKDLSRTKISCIFCTYLRKIKLAAK